MFDNGKGIVGTYEGTKIISYDALVSLIDRQMEDCRKRKQSYIDKNGNQNVPGGFDGEIAGYMNILALLAKETKEN